MLLLKERRYLRQAQGGFLAGSSGEVTWDVPCERPIRADGQDASDENRKAVGRRKTAEAHQKKPWLRPENGPLDITELMYKYPTCPPDAFVYIHEYIYNDNVNRVLPNDKKIMHEICQWCNKLSLWRLSDYNNYYNDPSVHPYFNAYNKSPAEVYYTVDESVSLGLFQHGIWD